jgi:uncharacterized LabA/DUF88 family protein
MIPKERNFAFIDSQNLYTELKKCGWKIDYKKLRIYLREKYSVDRAYIFIGYLKGNEDLYESFNSEGFECIFKPTKLLRDGDIKGNCDAELVLHTNRLFHDYDKAVIISGDGDFSCLVEYLVFHNKLKQLMVPNRNRYSGFLKRFRVYTAYFNDLRNKLEKKTPLGTEP